MYLSSLLLAAAMSAPASAPEPIDRGSWIRFADYPAAARRLGQEGAVRYRANIDPEGRPVSCDLTQPSGHAALDEATCRLVMERGRFRPARDAEGRALAASYEGRVVWRLARVVEPRLEALGQGRTVATLRLAPDGTVTGCSLDSEGGSFPGIAPPACERVVGRAPAMIARHAPQYGTVTIVYGVLEGGAPVPVEGATLLVRRGAELSFARNGRYVGCAALPPVGESARLTEPCLLFPRTAATAAAPAERRILHFSVYGTPR